jgi:hypothetical protein
MIHADPTQGAASGASAIHPAAIPGAGARVADPMASAGADESLGFFDLLDIVNPLQHIPVVSTVYRQLTGDEISAPARMIGGALFLGPIGFVASAFNAIVDAVSGRDVGETVLTALSPNADPAADTASEVSLAQSPEFLDTPQPVLAAQTAAPRTLGATAPEKGLFFQEMAARGRVLPAVVSAPTPRSMPPDRAADAETPAAANGFSSAMAEGWRKYEMLIQQRQAAQEAAGTKLDAAY